MAKTATDRALEHTIHERGLPRQRQRAAGLGVHNNPTRVGAWVDGRPMREWELEGLITFGQTHFLGGKPVMSDREIDQLRSEWEAATKVEFNEPWSSRTHNGCVTITNPKSGKHRTFRIHTQPLDAKFKPGMRILSLLVGPDNGGDFKQFAFVDEFGAVKVWRKVKSRVTDKFAAMIERPDDFMRNFGLRYQFEGKCRKCNRRLTSPESIENGIGPECAKSDWGF